MQKRFSTLATAGAFVLAGSMTLGGCAQLTQQCRVEEIVGKAVIEKMQQTPGQKVVVIRLQPESLGEYLPKVEQAGLLGGALTVPVKKFPFKPAKWGVGWLVGVRLEHAYGSGCSQEAWKIRLRP